MHADVMAPPRAASLELRASMSFDEWSGVGRRIARIASGSAWALGEWLLFGERRFGARYRSAIEATDLDYQTLRNYAWVARNVDAPRRRDELSFQHHAEVASLPAPEQDLWLHRAVMHGWSRNELRRRMRADRAADRAVPATVVRVEVSSDVAERWRRAAEAADQELREWVRAVTTAAADATLH
ncbi:LmbU family transcriptional regulator [Solirubrobacter phytolaccae]|uniref:LmbU family transcriptional regulator n=1 Tax=Solirubrobacter phytolaccae TaxID=1404360 RepID=A0A9X3N5B1_9ACTN|nr:LmbU family transcriptional regulator [Solirubrobacter phytolaccae]MDA0178740.1 LmbU family transcriptional regulator [Solirubrobacter phytolaccae]